MCLVLSSALVAQHPKVIKHAPTTCPNDPVLATDGRTSEPDLIFPSTEVFYTINAKGGHSYSVEVWDTFDPTANVLPAIQVFQGCTSPVPVTDTTSMPPDLSGGFSERVSWAQSADGVLNVAISNPDQINSYTYQIRVTDITLHSPRWSTVVGFSTHYGLLNNASVSISGLLTLTSIVPPQTYSATITIPAHNEAFVSIPSSSFDVPAGEYGFADFEFVGSPGAITADGYYQTVTNGIFSIAPTTFGPTNFQH
jgi:hypothetical protein